MTTLHFDAKKPHYYCTKQECLDLHAPVLNDETPIATFSFERSLYKKVELYDRKDYLAEIPFIEIEKDVPLHYLSKQSMKQYRLSVSTKQAPSFVLLDKDGKTFGLFDVSQHPSFEKVVREDLLLAQQIKSNALPLYTKATLPKHYLGNFNKSFYYIPEEAEAVGIYRATNGRFSYVYDASAEMIKPHYQYESTPIGFFSKHQLEEFGISLQEGDAPDAYAKYGKKAVSPLYDRKNHPKIRLKIVTGQL